MTMEYRRQQTHSGPDPGWMLICAILALIFCLVALPWIIAGFLAWQFLSRWLNSRLSFLLWLILLVAGVSLLYTGYQHGLQSLIQHELTDYVTAAKHHQADFWHWPLRSLWSETWPIWVRTWPAIGIAGFCAELYADMRHDTARTLRQHERNRERQAQRSQDRARKRASRPGRVPDEIAGMMVMGVLIHDDTAEKEA